MKRLIKTSVFWMVSVILGMSLNQSAVWAQASVPESLPPLVASGIPAAVAAGSQSETASDSEQTKVYVGIYILDIAHLDMKSCDFFADFYIWYKLDPNASGAWTPETIEFNNGTIELATTPTVSSSSDGRVYWSQRVKGRFRGNFNLHKYPFDSQVLPIVIEDKESPESKVLFLPDPVIPKNMNEWYDPAVQVPDWKVGGADLKIESHHYRTDFGLDGGKTDSKESYYSRYTYSIKLERLFIPHMIKFLIPLLVIAGMAYLVFYINASEFESQCAICVTSLLSAVALHISQADALPAVGYLVVADKMFILFYIVIFSALVQTVVANNCAKRGQKETAAMLDDVFRYAYILSLVLGAVIIGITS